MHTPHDHSPVQRRALGESAFDGSPDKAQGQSMAPPAFDLSGKSAQLKVQEGPALQMMTMAPIQRKDPSLPGGDKKKAQYGPAETGPIAEKGVGHADAFDRHDVNQGAIGDCYLLASLMALADRNPGLIKNAISGPDTNGDYDVTLYKKKGIFKKSFVAEKIKVSSSFVVDKTTGSNFYARGGDTDNNGKEEMWVRLIEKAYAKMKGGYAKIDGGFEEDALEALTGKEHSSHGFNGFLGIGATSDADLEKAISTALSSGKPVTASTKFQFQVNWNDKSEKGFAKANDIVGLHAYSVVSVDNTGITLRNPWGQAAANDEPKLTWAQFKKFFKNFTTED